METKLEHILTNSYKADMISYMKSHPEDFEEVVQLALSDQRLRQYIQKIIDILPGRNDNQQRELLIILQHMELDGEYEGKLFDICIRIWEKIGKKPSVRYNALRLMVKIATKHPGLLNEIYILTQDPYLENLSSGVKKSIIRLIDQNT
jgi:predicted Zn-dependent protease with MMP-like domain